jgi:Ni/Co efflux regulator RcnB
MIVVAPAIAYGQARGVHHSSTTVHRGGTTVHRSTTTVHGGYRASTLPAHRPVAAAGVYHPGHWNGRVVHAGAYRYPHGYTYHRWAVGRALPRVYLAPAYYYSGYAALGLMAPPSNFQWIRYGPDLMLVNLATGNVVDIRYGVFG